MADFEVKLRFTADGQVAVVTATKQIQGAVASVGPAAKVAGEQAGQGFGIAASGAISLGAEVNKARNAVAELVGALGGMAAAKRLAASFIEAADAAGQLEARMRLATTGQGEYAAVMDRVQEIARASYVSINDIAEVYIRSIEPMRQLGYATQETLDLTEAMSLSLVVSAADAQKRASAIDTLSKVMQTGTVQMQEFLSLANNAPRFMSALEESTGKTRAQLLAMVSAGELTAGELAKVGNVIEQLRDEVERMPTTVEDATTRFRDAFQMWAGAANEGLASTHTLVVVIDTLGEHINAVMTVAISGAIAAIGLATKAGAQWLGSLIASQGAALRLAQANAAEAEATLAAAQASVFDAGTKARMAASTQAAAAASQRLAAAKEAETTALAQANLAQKELGAVVDASRVKILSLNTAIGAVTAAMIGWNIGSYLRDQFESVRIAADILVGAVMEQWNRLKQGTLIAWEAVKGYIVGSLNTVRQALATMVGLYASALEKLPKGEALASSLREIEARLRPASSAAENFRAALARINESANAQSRSIWGAVVEMVRYERQAEATYNPLIAQARANDAAAKAATGSADASKRQADELKALAEATATFAAETDRMFRDADIAQILDEDARAAAEFAASVADMVEAASKAGMSTGLIANRVAAMTKAYRAATPAVKALQSQLDAAAGKKVGSQDRLSDLIAKLGGASKAQIDYNATLRDAEQAYERAGGAADETARKIFDGIRANAAATLATQEQIDALDALDGYLGQYAQGSPFEQMTRDLEDMQFLLASLPGLMGDAFDPAIARGLEDAIGAVKQKMQDQNLMLVQDGVSSLQRYAKEGTAAYTALGIAQDILAYRAAVAAIANQGGGDPYTAFARIAAMIAMMASIGIRVGGHAGGFADTASQRQAAQGTGSVLGDSAAKSESIARGVEITANATQQLVGINRSMLSAMQAMAAGLSGASTLMTRGAGDVDFAAPGPAGLNFFSQQWSNLANGLLGGLFGGLMDSITRAVFGARSKVTDTGILIGGGMLSQLLQGVSVGAFQETQSRSWWFGSTHTSTQTQSLGSDVATQFQLVLNSMADAVRGAADALGMDMDAINAAIASYRIEEIKISTKGLSAEAAQKELEAVFSKIFDGLAGAIVPFIGQFQKVGEGLGETLIRVATGVQVTKEAVTQLGFALDETDPEKFAQISEGLMDLMGGVDGFISGMSSFVNAFATDEHKFIVAQDAITRAFAQFGLAVPESRDAMWELMQSLDATTEQGREQIATLLQLAEVSDSYYSMLDEHAAKLRAIEQTLDDNAWSLYLDGLEQGQRDVVELTRYYDDLHDSLLASGATVEQLAMAEDQRALAMARLLEAQARQAAEEEAARVQALGSYRDFLAGILRETQQLTDYQAAMADAGAWQADAIASANEHARAAGLAGASEAALALIERRAAQMRAQALAQLRQETQSLIEQLYGDGGVAAAMTDGVDAAGDAAANYWEQQRRSAETLQNYLDSMLLGDLSALTPAEQLAEAWDQLNAAVAGGDADQATRLADVYLRMLREMEASGDDYNQGFWQVRELLQGMLDGIGPIPDSATDAGSGGLITAAGAEQIAAQNRLDLAVQLAQHLADLSGAIGQTVFDLMDSMGVDLRQLTADLGISLNTITGETVLALVNMADLLGANLLDLTGQLGVSLTDMGAGIRELAEQTGVNLDALTVESVQALGALANQLGIDLADIATSVGSDLGALADDQSLLNQALAAQIDLLPDMTGDALRPYLAAIEAATTQADATDAIGQMAAYINTLAPDIRDALAPYFAGVVPADPLADLDYLTRIDTSTAMMAAAAIETNTLLTRIANNLEASNLAADIPSFAVGTGYVARDGLAMIHQGEGILPAPVNAWMRQHGYPVTSGGGDSGAVVAELRAIGARLEALERSNAQGQQRIAETVAEGDNSARAQREQIARNAHPTGRSIRYG